MALFGSTNKSTYTVKGMTCGHCEMRVKKALTAVPGVQDAEASHERERATVTISPGQEVSIDLLVAAVTEAGYEAEPPA